MGANKINTSLQQTNFEFINYHTQPPIDKDGVFKVTRREKHVLPNTRKFRLKICDNTKQKKPNKHPEPINNFTFISRSSSLSRKTSYIISTPIQRVTLVQLVKKHKLYKRKPQIDAWFFISKQYNKAYKLDDSVGLSSLYAKSKFNRILQSAEEKRANDLELEYDEELAWRYKLERDEYMSTYGC